MRLYYEVLIRLETTMVAYTKSILDISILFYKEEKGTDF